MGSVFINYRRDETAGEARALFNDLASLLGADAVFMDVDNIALGRDFREALHERLASCDLMLVLVGRRWVDAKNAAGHRRLDDPNDYVRFEIVAALKRDIPVLPVLVQGAHVPAIEQLPEDIRNLAYRNAFELSHSRWESDVHEMIKRLGLSARRDAAMSAERGAAAIAPQRLPEAGRDPKTLSSKSAAESVEAPGSVAKLWLLIGMSAAVAIAGGGWVYYRTIAEKNARIEQVRLESAKAKADADAAKAALAALYAERDRSAAQAVKDKAAGHAAEKDRPAQAAKEKASGQTESERLTAQAPKEKPAVAQADRTTAQIAKDTPGVTAGQTTRDKPLTAPTEQPKAPSQASGTSPSSRPSTIAPEVQTLLQSAQALERGDVVVRNYSEAARLYKIAAEQGNASAQSALARMYQSGRGVPKDEAQALMWYRKAAAQGNADAQYALGLAYSSGRGAPKDDDEANKWFRQAATGFRRAGEQGDAQAQQTLGYMLLNGRGIPKDEQEALKWMRRSADQGAALAQYYVGVIYANGKGVSTDYAEAAKWYRKAADQGQVPAQYVLADFYAAGRGVAKDEAEAVKWYRRAAEKGNRDAQAALTRRGLTWTTSN